MGMIVRTVAKTVELAIVEISDSHKVSLKQTEGAFMTSSTTVEYSPDEAEQLALELMEAASGLRVMLALDAKVAEKATAHHAVVVAYSAHPSDPHLSLKIECPECIAEWGWCVDRTGAADRLAALALEHNKQVIF
ncbi:hypothetical protein [Subtercola sp. YIM 133946]|uniref:hypothetical protein n=1 Tax=Subtercola sp. YIM 133946 TaxID=3118909 RepID=UPI002F92B91F